MRKGNKVLAMVLALVLAVSMTACGGKKETPQEVYKAAVEKTGALSGMDADMDMNMTMTDGTETVEIAMGAAIKLQNVGKEDMAMDMLMEMGLAGMTMEIQTYYADGYYMMDMMGQKMKYEMPMEEALEQASVGQEPNVDILGDITMEEADGVKTLSYQVDAAKMQEDSVEEYMAILESMGMGDIDGTDVNLKTMDGTMTVNKDGYVASSTIHMVCTMTIEGTELDCDVQIAITYNNPGQDVAVEIPDVSEYTEIDPSMLG